MAARLYPTSLAEIVPWSRLNGTTIDEARKRFVQFVVLQSIAAARWRKEIAFKGGNALHYIYGNPRGTIDLDFTASREFPDDEQEIRALLDSAIAGAAHRYGIRAMCQRVRRNPSKPHGTMPTYDISVAYTLPGDRWFHDLEELKRPIKTVVRLEISINDLVCAREARRLDPRDPSELEVCTLEDVIAEKLRALLQQRVRKRNRKQDVYDIARMLLTWESQIDRGKVARFLLRKAAARNLEVRRSAFDEDIRERASREYDQLENDTLDQFIPFADAWQRVMDLVNELSIPE